MAFCMKNVTFIVTYLAKRMVIVTLGAGLLSSH